VSKRTKQSSGLTPYWRSECRRATVYVGDCREVMARMEPAQFHAVVCDPPYELITSTPTAAFHVRSAMKNGGVPNTGNWDSTGVAFDISTWRGVLDACRPGSHLLAFGGARTVHRITCAIEDAGYEVRDMLMWLYSSGYPKGLDIAKGVDKKFGASDLRKVVDTKVMCDTSRVRAGFVGAAHNAAEDVGAKREVQITVAATEEAKRWEGWNTTLKPAWEPIVLARKEMVGTTVQNTLQHECGGVNVNGCRVNGLWPANVLTDDSKEVLELIGAGSRFFFSSKASDRDKPHGKDYTTHPTIKPLDLMRYLVRLVCARGSVVLDPFCGSGSTGCAAIAEGVRFVGIEQSREYADIAVGRLRLAMQSAPEVVVNGVGRTVVAEADAPPAPRLLR
jgi:DNA modification methylase